MVVARRLFSTGAWVLVGFVASCAAGDRGPSLPGDGGFDQQDVADAPVDVALDQDADVTLPPSELCEACVVSAQCGSRAQCALLTTGDHACVPTCPTEFPDCPRAFQCATPFGGTGGGPDPVCLPVGELCCVDEDADGYGQGVGCMGTDCNDMDIAVHPQASERCNGVDDDCDGVADEEAADCGAQDCQGTSTELFEELDPGACLSAICSEPAV